jgi:fibronectin type 3 domain-containing protein
MKKRVRLILGLTVLLLSAAVIGCPPPTDDPGATPLPAPQNVTPTAVTSESIKITWTAVTDAEGYVIYRADEGSEDFSKVGEISGAGTEYTDQTVKADETYKYQVAALRGGTEGIRSDPKQVKTPSVNTDLEAPSSVGITPKSSGSVEITWDNVNDAEKYIIYRKKGDGPYEMIATVDKADGTNTSYIDLSVEPDTTYTYKVTSVDSKGQVSEAEKEGNQAKTPAKAADPVQPPTGLEVTESTADSITISWTGVSGAESYRIYRSTGSPDNFTSAGTVTGTTYIDTGLAPATQYKYRVAAVKGENESTPTEAVTGTTKAAESVKVYLDKGANALKDGDYDAAVKHYRDAYQQYPTEPEAIVYSVLADLAAISVDPDVRVLFQERLGVEGYPGTMGALFSDGWMKEYLDQQQYGEYYGSSTFPALTLPGWFKDTGAYTSSLTQIGGNSFQSSTTFPLLLAANLLEKNTGGLDGLFTGVLGSVFGAKFEEIAARVNGLGTATISIDQKIIDAFGLGDMLEGDGLKIGKAELDVLIASLRIIKATLEWVSSYSWEADLNFLKFDWSGYDNFTAALDKAKASDLPFTGKFLNQQSQATLDKSKADYIAALDSLINAYEVLGARDYVPQAAKNEWNNYKWIQDGLSKLRAAINGGAVFWIPETVPSGATWESAESSAMFGVDMRTFFTANELILKTVVEVSSDKPVFYGDDDSSTKITALTQIKDYGAIGFKLQTAPLKKLVRKAFDETDDMILPLLTPEIAEILYKKYYP